MGEIRVRKYNIPKVIKQIFGARNSYSFYASAYSFLQFGSYFTKKDNQTALENRISQGCINNIRTAFIPNHQKKRLSSTEIPINTHQARNVETENATVKT